MPIAFWYLSLVGGLITLAYAIYRRDPVFIAGQGIGALVYIRNLMLIYRQGSHQHPGPIPSIGKSNSVTHLVMHTPVSPTSGHVANLAILILLAGLLFFLGFGSMGLTDRDEGRNAEAGREMLETGNWVSPTFNYEPRFAKPALVYWLMSLSYRWFGIDEFSARLPSAVFGRRSDCAPISLSQPILRAGRGLARRLDVAAERRNHRTEPHGPDRQRADLFHDAVLVQFLAGLPRTAERARVAVDLLSRDGDGNPGQGAGRISGSARDHCPVSDDDQAMASVLARGRSAGGPLAVCRRGAPLVSRHVVSSRHAVRGIRTGQYGRPLPEPDGRPRFYDPVLCAGPVVGVLSHGAAGCLLPGIRPTVVGERREPERASRIDEHEGSPAVPVSPLHNKTANLEWFAAAWVFGVFVFFTLSSTRLAHYIGPLFPAAALLTATYWHRSLHDVQTRGRRASIHTMMVMGYALAIGFASLPSLYPSFAGRLTKEFPLATTIDSRQRAVSGLGVLLRRDGAGRLLWVE